MKSLLIGTVLLGTTVCDSGVMAQTDATAKPQSQPTTPAQPERKSPLLRPPPPNAGGPGDARSKLKPTPQSTLFNPQLDVKSAIDAAIKRGSAERRRVLIVWGHNGSRWSLRMQETLAVPEPARQIRYHYELVLADVAGSAFGPLNVVMAETYGAKFTQAPNMKPYLTVLETVGDKAGQPLVNRSSEGMEKPGATRTDGSYNSAKILEFLAEHRLPLLDGAAVVDEAKARAKSRGVPMLVFFNDLEDAWCLRFAAWLKRDDVGPVLGKYFEVLSADFFRWNGGAAQYARFGGEQSEAAPWYVVVDGDEKRLAPDKSQGEHDLGYPTGDEVPQFLKMLKRVAPTMADEDLKKIEASLDPKAAGGTPAKGG